MIRRLDLRPGNTVYLELNEEIKILKITDNEPAASGVKGYIQPGAPEEIYQEEELYSRPIDKDSLRELGFKFDKGKFVSSPGFTLIPIGKGIFHLYTKVAGGQDERIRHTVNHLHDIQNIIEGYFGKQEWPLK